MKPKWDWENEECIRILWELFQSGDGLKRISDHLVLKYQDAPTPNSINGRLQRESLLDMWGEFFGEEAVEAAMRAFRARGTNGDSAGPSQPPLRLPPSNVRLDADDAKMAAQWEKLLARHG